MGNTNQQSDSQLKFIQQLEDRHFGEVDIYRTQEGRVVMKLTRTHILGDKRQQQFQKIVEWTLKENNPCLVPIIHITNQQEKNICIQYQVAHIFTEYYNYTLQDLFNSKKEIEEAELWCLLQALLRLITVLRKNKLSINLSLNNVFLTLKGMPCIYLYHIRSIEESITYNQYGMGQQLAKILLQLGTNQNISDSQGDQDVKELLGVMSKLCNRYKLFGKLIKQLFNREKGQQQALQQIEQMLQKQKIKKASQVKLNRFKYLIPQCINSNQSHAQKQTNNAGNNQKPVDIKRKKIQDTVIKQHQDTFNKTDTKKKSSRETTESKEILHQFSHCKNNQIAFSKQQATKMLTELDRRKEENRLQMQKFQLKKEELLAHSEKQNKQNILSNVGHQQHNQSKMEKKQSGRRLAQVRKNSRRRS